MEPLKIGVLLSGSGTNLQAIIDAVRDDGLPVDIVKVISSRPDRTASNARGRRASPQWRSTATCTPIRWPPTRASWRSCARRGAEYVAMAGYMRKLTPVMLDAFPDRVLNLHPALLPSFKGAHAIRDAYEAGVKVTGVTVHFRERGLRQGPHRGAGAGARGRGHVAGRVGGGYPRGGACGCTRACCAGWRRGRVTIAPERTVHIA